MQQGMSSICLGQFAVARSCWSFLPIEFYALKKIKNELKLTD
jgi:hypothetical protein